MKKIVAIISLILVLALGFALFKLGAGSGEIRDRIVKDSKKDIYIKNGELAGDNNFTKEDDFIKSQKIDKELNKISDYGKGFTMNYYNDMDVDASMSEVKTVMHNDNMKIEVYYDDFSDNENSSYEAYKNYSNMFLEDNKIDHKKEFESNKKINDRETHILSWSRDKLKHVDNDKNHYMSVEMKSLNDENDVYTIFMKSTKPFETEGEENYMDIVESFRIIDKKATSKINTTFKINDDRDLNKETREFYDEYFLNDDSFEWGLFEDTAPRSMDYVKELEEKMDYNFDFLVRYDFFSSPEVAPMSDIEKAYESGKIVELTFQSTYDNKESPSNLYEILDGKYDDYFNEYAQNLKNFKHPILFRLNNEMNGDWCEYSSYHFSKDTDVFIESWKHIHDIFEENGVDNVLWVWNPHDISFPDFNWNNYLNYYPGDEYVDIIGLTGYNNGTYYPGEVWREFKEIYDPIYNEYTEIFEQPLMITEFSANSVGGDKITWINDMFDNMKNYDRIKVAIWWNHIDWDQDGNPARIYRLDESEEMIDTFKKRLQEYK